jgi:hypothetical protein
VPGISIARLQVPCVSVSARASEDGNPWLPAGLEKPPAARFHPLRGPARLPGHLVSGGGIDDPYPAASDRTDTAFGQVTKRQGRDVSPAGLCHVR